MADSKTGDKVFDVARPDKAKPDIGSKPMIVGHKSIAADPMVKTSVKKDDNEEPEAKLAPPSAVKKTLQPISADLKKAGKLSESDKKEPTEEPTEEPTLSGSTQPEEERKAPKPGNSIVAELESQNSEEDQDTKQDVDAETIALDREDNLRKIIESKEYHVIIKETKPGSTASFLLAFAAVVIVGGAAMYLLVDFGVLDLDVKLPFSISGNN